MGDDAELFFVEDARLKGFGQGIVYRADLFHRARNENIIGTGGNRHYRRFFQTHDLDGLSRGRLRPDR